MPELPLVPAFVGRAAELARVQAALAAARADRTLQLVRFGGGPGSGKSRLLAELEVLARREGVPCLLAACGQGVDRPFGPFIRLFQAWLPAVREAVADVRPEQRAALARLLPALGDPVEALPLEPREAQVLAQAAISRVLAGLAGAGAILALDDWQAADAASLATLAYMQRNARGLPLAVVVASAGEDGAPLPPLGAEDVAAAARSLLGGGKLPAGLAEALATWSGGVPGRLQRLMAHLLRTEALRRDGRHWVAAPGLAEAEPAFLAVALEPVASLPAPARGLAELVAVLGPDADAGSLAALSGLGPAGLAEAIAELAARGILEERDGRFGFPSSRKREAVYRRASEGQRLWLHALAALHLEGELAAGRRPDDDAPAALARHLIASRQTAKVRPAALAAAELAMGRGEAEAARALLSDALEADALAPGPHDAWRRDALLLLAAAERWRGDFEAMREALDRAAPLAAQLPEPGPQLRWRVLEAAYRNQRMTPAGLHEAIALLGEALALPVAEPLWQARGRYFLAQAYFYLGQRSAAAFAFEAAAEAAAQDGLPFWRAKSLAFLGHLQAGGDGPARELGFARMAEAAAIQATLGDRYGRCFTLALQGDALLAAMRLEEAEAVLAEQLAGTLELGVGEDHVTCLANLGAVRALQGRFRAAVEACDQALPLADAQGQTVALLIRAVAGYARVALGELAAGATLLAEAGEAGRGGAAYMLLHALPFLLEGWRWLGRPDEGERLVEETRGSWGANPDAALQAQVAALAGEARLALAGPAGLLAPEAPQGAPLARAFALRLEARLALARGAGSAAAGAAAALLALVEGCGAAALAAEARGLAGEAAIAAGRLDAAPWFGAMRRFAEAQGLPAMRAQAIAGEARATPGRPDADALALEASQLLAGLAEGLDPLARQAFLAPPAPPTQPPAAAPPDLASRVAGFADGLQALVRDVEGQERTLNAARRQLAALGALAARLRDASGLDPAWQGVLEVAREATRARSAALWRPAGGELACVLGDGDPALAAQVWAARAPMTDPTGAALGVPLGEGVLTVGEGDFHDADLVLLAVLCAQADGAIALAARLAT